MSWPANRRAPARGTRMVSVALLAASIAVMVSCGTPTTQDPGTADRTSLSNASGRPVDGGTPSPAVSSNVADSSAPMLRYFWAEGCGACARAAPFVHELQKRFPHLRIQRYEVSASREHAQLYRQTAAAVGARSVGVPAFFLGQRYWIGFRPDTAVQITTAVEQFSAREAAVVPEPDRGASLRALILPGLGVISLESLPPFVVTAAIAVVDGVNPCSFWVLTFLIGLMVRTGSRGRTLVVGIVFLGVTAAVYGLFMLGLFRAFSAAAKLPMVRIAVAALAVGMGAVNLKDFFAFKVGFSLTISGRFQSSIARRGRAILQHSGSLAALSAATAVFALGIVVVELPCTAGFPVIWSQYVASLGVHAVRFAWLFALYLLVYLVDEILLVAASLALMRRLRFGQSEAQGLKLLGGTVMIALGVCFLFAPEITQTLSGVAVVFGVALIATAAVLGGTRIMVA